MTVSVILPTKDRPEFLRRVVPSYLAQPEVHELIIVDDGSAAPTAAVVAELMRADDRIRVVRHEVNRGIPSAKNSGIAAATGPLVLFGEDDLELTDGYLRVLIEHRERHGVDIISGRNVWRFQSESAEEALGRQPDSVESAVDRRRVALDQSLRLRDDTVEPLLPATMLAARSVFASVGFDERYRDSGWREESDFQLRALASGHRLMACPHALSFNYMLDDDRGGAHASIGLRRLYWQHRNNRLFLASNAEVLRREFDIGNPAVFLARSLVRQIWRELIFPSLLQSARAVRGRLERPGREAAA